MNKETFKTTIQAIFTQMNNMTSGGDKYFANNLAAAVKTLVSSGVVSSSDDYGTVSETSVYKGAGSGSMTINDSTLATDLYNTFTKKDATNDDFADGIADNVDSVCSASNTVNTTTVGTLTLPNGATSNYSGSGKGTFSGSKTTISKALKTAFNTMNTKTSGGNDDFANALADSITSYLMAGTIQITLQSPITGSATGKIA